MNNANWELLKRQGTREVWMKRSHHADGTETVEYKGEEYIKLEDERKKKDEVRNFDTETQALAWLNAGVG